MNCFTITIIISVIIVTIIIPSTYYCDI